MCCLAENKSIVFRFYMRFGGFWLMIKLKTDARRKIVKVPRGGCYSYAVHGKWITHAGVLPAIQFCLENSLKTDFSVSSPSVIFVSFLHFISVVSTSSLLCISHTHTHTRTQ